MRLVLFTNRNDLLRYPVLVPSHNERNHIVSALEFTTRACNISRGRASYRPGSPTNLPHSVTQHPSLPIPHTPATPTQQPPIPPLDAKRLQPPSPEHRHRHTRRLPVPTNQQHPPLLQFPRPRPQRPVHGSARLPPPLLDGLSITKEIRRRFREWDIPRSADVASGVRFTRAEVDKHGGGLGVIPSERAKVGRCGKCRRRARA